MLTTFELDKEVCPVTLSVQQLREDVRDAMRSWTDSLPQERLNQCTCKDWCLHLDALEPTIKAHGEDMQDDPAWVDPN